MSSLWQVFCLTLAIGGIITMYAGIFTGDFPLIATGMVGATLSVLGISVTADRS